MISRCLWPTHGGLPGSGVSSQLEYGEHVGKHAGMWLSVPSLTIDCVRVVWEY